MAIAAQRFRVLDKQTNVAVSDFLNSNSSDILNAPTVDLLVATDQLSALVDGNKATGVTALLNTINGASLVTSRLTKDFYSSINDLSRMTSGGIKDLTARMFPGDPVLQNVFNGIGEGCKSKILAGLSNCKNKKNTAKINGKTHFTNNRSCSASSFVGLINKLTGDAYKATLIDQCALSKMIAGVAIRGFEIGLPSVFSALSGKIEDKYLLAQTGGMVISAAALDGNMNAVMDVANSSVGGMIRSINPGITNSVMSNFQLPPEYMERDQTSFYEQFSDSMDRLDDAWCTADFNGERFPSIENMDSGNTDLTDMYACTAADVDPVLPEDDQVPDPTHEQYMYAGLTMGSFDTGSSIGADLGYVPLTDNLKTTSAVDHFESEW